MRHLVFIFYINLLISTSPLLASPIDEYYLNKNIYNVAQYSSVSFKDFQQIIAELPRPSIESTLNALKKFSPQLFSNYILMYHSRSLQNSSFEFPRAIVFDNSGKFVFTFNGHSSQNGFNSIEIMHFIDDEKRFEFREIVFSRDGNQPPQVSQPNPVKCLACHQSTTRTNIDPRPNWEPYDIWPGSYGSIKGKFPSKATSISYLKKQGVPESLIRSSYSEKKKYTEFLSKVKNQHNRYRFLDDNINLKNNTRFTEILAVLNAQRVGRLLSEVDAELLENLKYTLLGLFKCQRLMVTKTQKQWLDNALAELGRPQKVRKNIFGHSSYPHQVIRAYNARNSNSIYPDAVLRRAQSRRLRQLIAEGHRQRMSHPSMSVAAGITTLLEPFGISTIDWSMDFQTNGKLAFEHRFGTPNHPEALFEAAYRNVFGHWENQDMCVEIGMKSEQAMQQLLSSPVLASFSQDRQEFLQQLNAPLINRCTKCHTSSDISVPYIPFNQPNQLKNILHQPALYSGRPLIDEIKYRIGPFAAAHERMPLGSIPSTEQTDALIKYLENL